MRKITWHVCTVDVKATFFLQKLRNIHNAHNQAMKAQHNPKFKFDIENQTYNTLQETLCIPYMKYADYVHWYTQCVLCTF